MNSQSIGQRHFSACVRGAALAGLLWTVSLSSGSFVVAQQNARINVALFIDRGTDASEFTKEFKRSEDAAMTFENVDSDDIRSGMLRNFDAIVIPGGSASEESASLGPEARAEIQRFVRDGGIYMGVCAGAYLASQQREHDLGLLPLTTVDSAHWYRVDDGTPVDVELTPEGMEIFGIRSRNIQLVYENGPIFAPQPVSPDPNLRPLAFFRSEVVANGGTRGVMLGAPAIVLSKYGRGSVLVLSPHPEETPGLKQSEVHALHWLYDHRSEIDTKVSVPSNDQRAPVRFSERQRAVSSSPPPSKIPDYRLADTRIPSTAEPITASTAIDTSIGEKALKLAQTIFQSANVVRYTHNEVPASEQVFTDTDGTVEARTDCSGFVSYIVHSVAPRHYKVVRRREPQASYPQAKIWARFFDTLDSSQPQDGWLAVPDWHNLQAGDIIAWESGKSASGNTGHVMIAAGRPSGVQQTDGYRYIEISVIDSSSVYHFPPERLPPNAHQEHRNGLGTGRVRVILSDSNAPIGYWEGSYWGEGEKQIGGPTLSNLVRFARMVPLQQEPPG